MEKKQSHLHVVTFLLYFHCIYNLTDEDKLTYSSLVASQEKK